MRTKTGPLPVFCAALTCCLASLIVTPRAVPGDDSISESARIWPQPVAVISELQSLSNDDAVGPWARATIITLEQLGSCPQLAGPRCTAALSNLDMRLGQLDQLAKLASASNSHQAMAARLRRLHYSLIRRRDIWRSISQIDTSSVLADPSNTLLQSPFRQASNQRLSIENLDPGWIDYLALTEAAASFNSLNPDRRSQMKAARQSLARFYSPALSRQQHQFLSEQIQPELLGLLKDYAVEPVDVSQLLDVIEKVETRGNGNDIYHLNHLYQNLLWSNDASAQRLAGELHKHYRNANYRMSVSERLLNSLIPAMPETKEPFRDQILGAQVFGQNRIINELRVRLQPDPEHVHLNLETSGKVLSRTRAQRSGFTIHNEGVSRFRVIKRLAFGREGIVNGQSQTTSSTQQRVTGMRSNLDGIPLVGWMAHRIARQKIEQQTPATNRIARRKLEDSAQERFDDEVAQSLDEMGEFLRGKVIEPLVAMDLEPETIETRTTPDQVIMRYRLAGRDQMAASTARPTELENSLLSIQVHESLFNNLLQRLELAGKTFTPEQLSNHFRTSFNLPLATQSSDMPSADVRLEFAPFDPVRIDFDENLLTLTINLKSMQIGKGKKWRRLTIRAFYEPQVHGNQIVLVQDPDGISLKGSRLKLGDQMAIRTVFTKLFEDSYIVNAIPPQVTERVNGLSLQIGQLAVTNDWLGISVVDSATTPAATAGQAQRRLMFKQPRQRR